MDVSGERRLPAAREVVWRAMSDLATLTESLPPGCTVERRGHGFGVRFPGENGGWHTEAVSETSSGPAQSIVQMSAPAGVERGFGGRADITMAEDGVFTRLLWRLAVDLPDSERETIEAAIDRALTHLGQRAATPAPIAAEGLAGATAAAVNAATSGKASPLAVIGRTLAGMPRDSTIGGAVFILVVLFVVGIL